jgi:hypothetical protein
MGARREINMAIGQAVQRLNTLSLGQSGQKRFFK